MTAFEYHQLLIAAQTVALGFLAVALIFLGMVLWRVAHALQRLQATRLAVLSVDEASLPRGGMLLTDGVVGLRRRGDRSN